MNNPFDQFDAPAAAPPPAATAANPFDQFDGAQAPAQPAATPAPAPAPTYKRTAGYAKAAAEAAAALHDAPLNGDARGLITQAAQGADFGLTDEAGGALAALKTGGQNFLAGMGIGKPAGYGMSDAYHATVDADRGMIGAYAQAHPIASAAANVGGAIAGGFATPLMGAAGRFVEAAPSFASSVARSAGVGGAISAAQGAGNATGGFIDRGKAALESGAIGAGLGAAAPALITAARAVPGLITGAADTGVSKAQQQAMDYVASKLKAQGVSADDIAANPAAARGITVAEALGPDAVGDAAALARRPGTTGALARDTIGPASDRATGRTGRLTDDIAQATGVTPDTAQSDVDSFIAQGRENANPLYDAFRDTDRTYMTAPMKAVLQTPAGKSALGSTYNDLLNGVPGGGPSPESMGIYPAASGGYASDGLHPIAIDMVKKNLDAATRFNPLGGAEASNANKAVDSARDAFVSSARDAVPGYADALDAAGDYKSVQAAFNNGRGLLLGTAKSPDDVQAIFDGLRTSGEADAVRSRMAADLMKQADAGLLTPGKLMRSDVGKKLDIAFGDGTAQKIASAAQMEAAMSASGTRMVGNSVTSDVLMHAAQQDDALQPLQAGLEAAKVLRTGKPVQAALAYAANAVMNGLQKGGDAAAAPQAEAVRNAIGDIYLSPARDFSDAVVQRPNIPPVAPIGRAARVTTRVAAGATAPIRVAAPPPQRTRIGQLPNGVTLYSDGTADYSTARHAR